MTNSKEEYLKTIWHLGGRKRQVAPKEIAGKLKVQAASVTEMLLRLSKEGLLDYEAYRGAQLTPAGIELCANLVRSHEIWEVFLVRHLGYRLSEAHDEADRLEHATSPRLMERLDDFLNYPSLCPHGASVPRPGHLGDRRRLIPLTEVQAGRTARIARVEEEPELLDYLERIGLELASSVEVLRFGDYGGPIHLRTQDGEIEVNLKAAEKIEVVLQRSED